jgi:endonuclease YncB( thermonuclease family)
LADWSWPQSLIVRVVDGDTLDAVVTRDLGFNGTVSWPVRLRLNRVNAPALKTAAGRRAHLRAAELLPAGSRADLLTVKPYKYSGPAGMAGEWMCEVTLPDGRNLSDTLVAEGHAVFWDGNGPRPADS